MAKVRNKPNGVKVAPSTTPYSHSQGHHLSELLRFCKRINLANIFVFIFLFNIFFKDKIMYTMGINFHELLYGLRR